MCYFIYLCPSCTYHPQNIFNSIVCLLFAIILILLQCRVIKDHHLPILCYGILLFAAAICFVSMPTLGNVFPVDTKEVSKCINQTVREIAITKDLEKARLNMKF